MNAVRTAAASALLLLVAGCDHVERPGRPFPDTFVARTLDGKVVDRSTLKGKPWVLNIWLPGCGICAREFPALETVRRKYEEKGVGFLAISVEQDPGRVEQAAKKMSLPLDVAYAQSEVLGPLGVRLLPSTVFVDEHGVIVAAVNGAQDAAYFERRVRELLKQ
ncbi:MAG: TlpA family protein disulfide reductase [Myxococcaceae bacterium]|nr:TlpA family protein disulfide reductase [Myxococcaceae bacterium]